LVAQANLLTAMRSRLLPAVLAGLVLLALLPVAASAHSSPDDQLDMVTDLMRVGWMDEALANLTALQEANPDHLRAWMIKGLILGYVGRADEGGAEVDERLAADSADGGGLALAIGLAIADGNDTAAEEASARLVVAFPESADAWDIRGGVLSLKSGEDAVREARIAFDRALAIDPEHVDALINRGELVGATDPDDAERFLRRAVEARTASTDANDAWTTFLIGQNRTAEAIEAYDAWLRERPTNPTALMGKAIVLADEGDCEAALSLVENAVRDDPGYRDGLYLKGELLLELDRPDEAVDAMNDLLALYPDDEDAESLRSQAATAVQAAASGDPTRATATPATESPAPAGVALLALFALGAVLRFRR
jgi:tetratricopeptide (TPR) repeat protein